MVSKILIGSKFGFRFNCLILTGIVNSPVSAPAPLYAANELAKRGRNNYRTKLVELAYF